MRTEDFDDLQIENANGYPDFADAYIGAAHNIAEDRPATVEECEWLTDNLDMHSLAFEACL